MVVRPKRCSEARAKNIIHMIVQDPCPIYIVECNGFHDLMNYLEPGYILPSREQSTTDINFKHAHTHARTHARTHAHTHTCASNA